MASRGVRGWQGAGGRGALSRGGRNGGTYRSSAREADLHSQAISRRDPYSAPARGADPYAEASSYPYNDPYGDTYRDPYRDPYNEQDYGADPYSEPTTGAGPYREVERTAPYGKPGRGGATSRGRGRGSDSGYPNIGAASGAYKRPGPAKPYSEVDVKKPKISNMAEMNRLLGESQREVQSLSAGADPSYLNQVLQKQQKLIEMQSKLLAVQEASPRRDDSYAEASDYGYNDYRESDYFPTERSQGLYDKPQPYQKMTESNDRGGRGGRGGRGRRGHDRAIDNFARNSKTTDPKPSNDLYDPFEQESIAPNRPVPAPVKRPPPSSATRVVPAPTSRSVPARPSPDVPPHTSRNVPPSTSRGIRPSNSGGLPERPPPAAVRRQYFEDPYAEEIPYHIPSSAEDPYVEGAPRLPVRRGPPVYEHEDLYRPPVDPYAFADEYMEEDPYRRPSPRYEDERLRAYPPPPDPYLKEQHRRPPQNGAGGDYTMSVEGKLNNFMRLLFNYEDLNHAVSAIETTRNRNTDLVKIRTDYNVEENQKKDPPFVAFLRINGVIMDIQEGYDKYRLKDEVYKKAVYLLLTKSVSEIFANSCRLLQSAPVELKVKLNPRNNKGHRFIPSRLKTLIYALRDELKETVGYNSEENLVFALDVASGNADAAITQIYYQKSTGDRVRCEVYADDLMLGAGESIHKKSSYHNAYRNAKDMLLAEHRNAETVLRDNGRLQDIDIMRPDIIDIVYKAKNHSKGSNLFGLKKLSPNTFQKDIETKKDIIVYEFGRRDESPYKKLEDLALTNRVLLEFSMYSKNGNDEYRCFIFLQGEIVGDSYGHTRMGAKMSAATNALKYLHDNYSVIEVSDRNYKNTDYSFGEAKTQAENLKVEMPQLDLKFDVSSYTSDKPNDPQPNELTPWVDEAIKSFVKHFHQREGFEELVIENDFPEYHLRTFKKICQELSLNIFFKNKDAKSVKGAFIIVTKELPSNSTVLVETLRGIGSKSGRYKLIQWKDENDVILRCVHK